MDTGWAWTVRAGRPGPPPVCRPHPLGSPGFELVRTEVGARRRSAMPGSLRWGPVKSEQDSLEEKALPVFWGFQGPQS